MNSVVFGECCFYQKTTGLQNMKHMALLGCLKGHVVNVNVSYAISTEFLLCFTLVIPYVLLVTCGVFVLTIQCYLTDTEVTNRSRQCHNDYSIPLNWICTLSELLSINGFITMTSQWTQWRLKSPASRLFTKPFIPGADKRKHQNSASLAFVRGIHLWPVNPRHKKPLTRKMFPFDDVIILATKMH